MNLLVDDEDKARLNRERVANGYGNEGYDLECGSMKGAENAPEPSWAQIQGVLGLAFMGIPRPPDEIESKWVKQNEMR